VTPWWTPGPAATLRREEVEQEDEEDEEDEEEGEEEGEVQQEEEQGWCAGGSRGLPGPSRTW